MRNSLVIKVPNRRAKKAKLVEWVPRPYAGGIRDVPVKVRNMASPPKPRKRASRRSRAACNDTLQHETPSQPMDVDETFWAEEPVIPTNEKKVRQTAYSSSLPQ
jgi:hypothetical protein